MGRGAGEAGAAGAAPPPEVAGLEAEGERLGRLLAWPGAHAGPAARLGVEWPTGALLSGAPGTGKSSLARAAAARAGAEVVEVTAGSVMRSELGGSERALREAFARAGEAAASGRPVLLLLDEVDALCPRRGRAGPHEARVASQLLALVDRAHAVGQAAGRPSSGCSAGEGGGGGRGPAAAAARGALLLVGTTNRPGAVDPALRRPGRLEVEIRVGAPSEAQREAILRLHARRMPLGGEGVDLGALARGLRGFTGADIAALCRGAALAALADEAGRASGAGGGSVREEHFTRAAAAVQPSALRQLGSSAAVVPRGGVSAGFADVVGAGQAKRELAQAVLWPLKHGVALARLGVQAGGGVLLYGPPGCCKTRLAAAAAGEAELALVTMSCADVFGSYLGESEARLRHAFAAARAAAPCVLFLDEVDALVPGRGGDEGGGGGGELRQRVLATFLTEMDGLESGPAAGKPQVAVVGATNRPEALDPALLRPGRLGTHVYVGLPDLPDRELLFRKFTGRMELAPPETGGAPDFPALAAASSGFTGAEVQAVCREALLLALRERRERAPPPSRSGGQAPCGGPAAVGQTHLEAALAASPPATKEGDLARYRAFRSGG